MKKRRKTRPAASTPVPPPKPAPTPEEIQKRAYEIYLARVCKDLHIEIKGKLVDNPEIQHISPTVKQVLQFAPDCAHDKIPYWKADCPECAHKALRMAIALKTKYEPVRQIDPHEDPIIGSRTRRSWLCRRGKSYDLDPDARPARTHADRLLFARGMGVVETETLDHQLRILNCR